MARIIDRAEKNLIGDKVRELRETKGFSQKDLSVRLELMGVYVCRGSISRIEDKSRTVTDIELYAIAKALEVDVIELIDNSMFNN